MFWIELIIVLAIIFIGVRVGGTFLAMAGGIGMFIMTFILHVTPSDPPITVILIMIAVICAAATMQACGGLDYLVRIAEKILRKNPKMITVLATVVRKDALEKYPKLKETLELMDGILTDQKMAELNYQVEEEGRDEADVGEEFLKTSGLL